MLKVIQKILNVISIIVILAAVFVLLTVIMTKKGEAPNIFGYSMFRVMTGSMEPEIKTDSMIVVKKVSSDTIQINDIITFYSNDPSLEGAVNTHRVTDITEDNGKRIFSTKGDNNAVEDKYPVPEDRLIGIVIAKSHGFGVFVHLISNPIVFIPLIVIPFIIIILSNFVKTIKLTREIMKEEEEAAAKAAAEKINELRRKKAEQRAQEEMQPEGKKQQNEETQQSEEKQQSKEKQQKEERQESDKK